MISIHILEEDDTIDMMDWVRPLDFDGDANTFSIYSGKPDNNTKWVRVHEYFGPWVFGIKISKLYKQIDKTARHAQNRGLRYEFARGMMPSEHVWNLQKD